MSDLAYAAEQAGRPTAPEPSKGQLLLQKAADEKTQMYETVLHLMEAPIRRSDTVGKLALALAQAQGKIQAASRDSANPFFKSKYASLASVLDACREPLAAAEIAYFQPVQTYQRIAIITTLLVHSSGEWIESTLVLQGENDQPQKMGGLITYGRRYGLSALVGVAAADDDGNEASGLSPAGVRHDTAATPLQRPGVQGASDELPDVPEASTPPQSAAEIAKQNREKAIEAAKNRAPKAAPAPPADAPVPKGSTPPPPGMRPPMKAPGVS